MLAHVIVISANGGVGLAVTRAMLIAGYDVTATVSREARIEAFAQEIEECRDVIALDLSVPAGFGERLRAVADGLPALRGVVVCGAVSPFAPAEFTTIETFRHAIDVNCTSHLAIYQAVLPALRRTKGRLIFTGSFSGKVATPMMAAYCASKFALEGLADVMRQEAGAWGVKVVLLQPGTIETPALGKARDAITANIAGMGAEEDALYGDLHRQMLGRVETALETGGMTPAARVAEVAVQALEAEVPETRYRIGEDAEMMIEMSRTRSDAEIDALVLGVYQPETVSQ